MTILRRLTDFVLQNRLQAMGLAFVLAYLPLVGSLSIIIVGLVTLRKGAVDGLLVLIAAILACVLRYYAGISDDPAFGLFVLNIIIFNQILVWVFAILLKHYNNWRIILEYGILLALVMIGLVHVLVPDIKNWWIIELTRFFNNMNVLSNIPAGDLAKYQAAQTKIVQDTHPYATGLMIVFIMVNALVQLMIARWWQAVMFNPGGLRKELHNIRISHIVSILFILCCIMAFLNNSIAIEVMPVVFTLFAIAGLSLLHYYMQNVKAKWLWMSIIYIGLIILIPESFIVLSMIALLDSWLNIRKRWVKQ